ncbi:hypothetical protein DFQ14_1105 [Halopolyspora algeriensis]|uniref:Uncharacterized protein n=1 Tax=Halopolyspora algeriensis TaxID=1500506 RepID=A0A368VH51_9ACTN|nr:hypothetical protein [Halopolyspora algeriensis]RCW40681.1 hypothetical protein DFQ14_1105 [Halopolyspora algeriensis]TQM53396.1 hypothetical protein FHU43_2793 [Halopolyspora algeriensis]
MIAVRFGYTLDEVPNPSSVGGAPLVASAEVDADRVDPEQLREDLHAWAVEQLARGRHEFGLYTAEFGTWKANRDPGYYLRQLHLLWGGDEVLATYTEDSRVNVAGVRALTVQAEAFEQARAAAPRS